MKTILNAVMVLSALFFCACSDSPAAFTVTGELSGADSLEVRLEAREDGQWVPLDSATVENGRFRFTGSLGEARLLYLKLIRSDGRPDYFPLFLEDAAVTVTGLADSLDSWKVTGSVSHALYEAFQRGLEPLYAAQDTLYQLYRELGPGPQRDSLERLFETLEADEIAYTRKFIADNAGSAVAAYLALKQLAFRLDYNELLPVVQELQQPAESRYMADLHKTLDKLRYLVEGAPAPVFTETDRFGKAFRLDSLHGKYVLLDFWASWCGPCRVESPEMVRLYETFGGPDFEIVGISLDKDREKWLGAIEDDGLDWIQVSDLQGWKSAVAGTYSVKAIPQTYLLDREGHILAKGLRGGALYDRLAGLLPDDLPG